MKHSCVVSLVVAALAFAVVPGCKSGGNSEGGGNGPSGREEPLFKPPGLAPGLVQIFKTDPMGNDTHIGYAACDGQKEVWLLKQGYSYPVMLQPGEWLKFHLLGPISQIDTNPQDGKVTSDELCAASLMPTAKPGGMWTIYESVSMDGNCQ